MDSEPMQTSSGSSNAMQFQSPPTIRNMSFVSAAAHQLTGKPLTPRNNASFCTPTALHRQNNGRFLLFQPANNTPPSRMPPRIHNPFEAALLERLHLPMIGSPSLFNVPRTPQHSSTKFEWTIDEVSSLNPANVEAYETQFISDIDPEQEAKAQAAISSYFKDKLSVPSPIDCPLRNQKIIIPTSSSIIPPRPIRDAICQTELTLPPILPPEIEEALRPFCTYTQDQQQSPSRHSDTLLLEHEARDASLRRKLFETSLNSTRDDDDFQIDMYQCNSPAPTSPEIGQNKSGTRNFDSPTEHKRSFDVSLSPVLNESQGASSSFGSISPISRTASSPTNLNQSQPLQQHHNSSSIYQSTPGTSSVAYRTCHSLEISTNMSVDRSVKCSASRSLNLSHVSRNLSKSFSSDHFSMFMDDDEDMENLPPSSSSTSSSRPASSSSNRGEVNCISPNTTSSSQHSETPSRKIRYAKRRNLSLSFGSNLSVKEPDSKHPADVVCYANDMKPSQIPLADGPLSQTDSGFNDMEE